MGRLGLLFIIVLSAARADPAPKIFRHPDRVRYDGRCLTIDGRDTFIFSGSFHYFRCPKPLWPERFRRMKEAGCNAVETYVPWNWHERTMPASPDDFSHLDLAELKEWMRMAHDEFGLYTIIRPGPYICAEWDGGGFPRWLLTKVPAGALRTDDPAFLAWSRHWMKAVCPVIAAEQVTRRPPGHGGVILVQIENEYDLYRDIPEWERAPHLRALYQAAVASGIEVPIFTCWTRQCRDSDDPELGQVFDAVNSYPRFDIDLIQKRIHALQAAQPDAPVMISELQGGWFSKVGDLLSEDQPGLSPEQLNAHTLLAIQEGATLLNYYMAVGGTNFGLWAARDITTTYDYDAPIREAGGVGAKYRAMAAIGRMLQLHGAALARSRSFPCQAETGSPDVAIAARRDRAGGTYIFLRNQSLAAGRRGSAVVWLEHQGESRIDYDLAPFGFKVLYLPPHETDPRHGEWLPRPEPEPARPARLPAAVRPQFSEMRADPGPSDPVAAPAGMLLPELGVFDARAVVYATRLSLASPSAAPIDRLRLEPYPGDPVTVEVNGHVLPGGREVSLGAWLQPGENSVRVFYLQAGEANVQAGIQDRPGLRSLEFDSSQPRSNLRSQTQSWVLNRELGGIAAGWPLLPAGEVPGWTEVPLDRTRPLSKRGTLADAPEGPADALAIWHRVEFELPLPAGRAWIPWHARIDASGDGMIFLNGRDLGRYWEQGPQREYYLPECWLVFGPGLKNRLTLCLSPVAKGVRLRAVEVAPYEDQAEIR